MPCKDKETQLAVQRAHYERNKLKVKEKTRIAKRNKRIEWMEYKKTLACVKCGQNHPATLDFHHVLYHPDNQKLNDLMRRSAWKLVWEELKKCVVLCANCHRIHHHDERITDRRHRKAKKAVQSTHTHQTTPSGDKD